MNRLKGGLVMRTEYRLPAVFTQAFTGKVQDLVVNLAVRALQAVLEDTPLVTHHAPRTPMGRSLAPETKNSAQR